MKKLNLEKFRIAKLTNPKVIFGGDDTQGETNQTDTIVKETQATVTRPTQTQK